MISLNQNSIQIMDDPFLDLDRQIYDQPSQDSSWCRIGKTFRYVQKDSGSVSSVAMGMIIFLGMIYMLGASYFCLEGVGRSLVRSYEALQQGEGLSSPLGNAGGWFSLSIFSLYSMRSFFKRFMKEGDFASMKETCISWSSHQSNVEPLIFYEKVHQYQLDLSSQCFMTKNVFRLRQDLLDIMNQSFYLNNFTLFPENELTELYATIGKDVDSATSCSMYFHRIYYGVLRVYNREGLPGAAGSVISGVAIPIILGVCCLFSLLGEGPLGAHILRDRQDLEETGHLGEWPYNFIESFLFAYFLHKQILVEGDVVLMKNIFEKYIRSWNGSDRALCLLRKTMNEELEHRIRSNSFGEVSSRDIPRVD